MAIFVGCIDGLFYQSNCDGEMDEIRQKEGTPEEVNRYDSEDYHSVSWWYWSKGIEYTFVWGEIIDGCEVSTYTFPPIEAQNKKLIKRDNCCKKNHGNHEIL